MQSDTPESIEPVPDSAICNPQSAIDASAMAIGFIGFGEAGFHLASGLGGAGLTRLFAYDINTHTSGLGEKIRQRAQASGVTLLASPESLAGASAILLSTVTADQAATAARQTAPFLGARHLYADLNSVSPSTKQLIESTITAAGARFVEAAVMAAVAPHGHRVPMLLGGRAAAEFAGRLAPYGMRLEVVADEVGAASAIKMCRSIMIKGMEALVLECAMGASRYGAEARVFASLDETFPGMNWSRLAGYLIGRLLEHGERRAREMEEVAETLRAAGIEPMMAEAAARRQQWGAHLGLLDRFGGTLPEDYRDVVRAITDSAEKK